MVQPRSLGANNVSGGHPNELRTERPAYDQVEQRRNTGGGGHGTEGPQIKKRGAMVQARNPMTMTKKMTHWRN